MTTKVDALGRLGVPTVRCGSCGAKILKTEAVYLRRLWLDVGEPTASIRLRVSNMRTRVSEPTERILYYACSRRCAETLEAESIELEEVDSVLWLDDSHLTAHA